MEAGLNEGNRVVRDVRYFHLSISSLLFLQWTRHGEHPPVSSESDARR